jgi:hypothetical protein
MPARGNPCKYMRTPKSARETGARNISFLKITSAFFINNGWDEEGSATS